MTEHLALHIDLAAELRTIAERQHLNQVHWTVQLVRHALLHGPRAIRVRSTREWLELEHDGAPWSREEHDLILAVLSSAPLLERQRALSTLEKRHGVALLSLLYTSSRVEILSAWSVVAEGGRVKRTREALVPGYRIRVHRVRRSRRAERAEIVAYCRHAEAELTYDGRKVGAPLAVLGALWPRAVDDARGRLLLGLSEHDSLSRTSFYKQGVYYGLKQSVPEDGAPIAAAFSSGLRAFEENFRASTQAGNAAVAEATDALLQALAAELPTMPPRRRRKVRAALLRSSARRAAAALSSTPLFDATDGPFRLSLEDLRAEAQRRGFVAYVPRRAGVGPPGLPLLSPDEVRFLERHLGKGTLRRALGVALPGLLARARRRLSLLVLRLERSADARARAEAPLDETSTPAPVLALVEAARRQGVEVVPIEGPRHDVDARGGRVRVRLGTESPALREALRALSARPEHPDLAVALLLHAS